MKKVILSLVISLFIIVAPLHAEPYHNNEPVYLHIVFTGLQYQMRHLKTAMNNMKECLTVLTKSQLKVANTEDELPIAAAMWCGRKTTSSSSTQKD